MSIKDTAIFVVLFPFFLSVGIGYSEPIPGSAPVVISKSDNTYHSNKCVDNEQWDMSEKFSVDEAKAMGSKPNKECARSGGFTYDTKLLYHWLGAKGRWN